MVVALTACANVASQCGAWSNATHDRPEWQTAMKMLLLAGEQAGPLMFAWISIRRALDAGRPPTTDEPRRKAVKKFKLVR